MSYTSIEQIRPYLSCDLSRGDCIRDLAVTLKGTEFVRFYGGAIDDTTLIVKAVRSSDHSRATITLTTGLNQITPNPLMRGSVVVASDSSLGTVYVENEDYVIDYDNGTLELTSGSALEVGTSITVWFCAQIRCTPGTDYQINSTRGEIRRLAGGLIAAGETVYLNFSPAYEDFTDDLLASAVLEANGLIERDIDPLGDFGADPMLGAAATSRALEIVCRAAAMRSLAGELSDDKIALAWMKIAESHAARADQLIRSFRPPAVSPATPAIS